ncbi:MAG: hypothetical protein FJ014_14535 [Chloroflexi bacterium]|nr:hypothetical protein [Chloroflexota bacterium]
MNLSSEALAPYVLFFLAATVVILLVVILLGMLVAGFLIYRHEVQENTGGDQAAAVTGRQRVAADVSAVAAMGWPCQLRRLPDGRLCLWLHIGQREGLPVDAFLLLPTDYPLRPPQAIVACGQQRLPLNMPSLAGWTAEKTLAGVVAEVIGQIPGLQLRAARRLTPEGELA